MNNGNAIPENVKNPYPSKAVEVVSASFATDLCLGRKAKAIRRENSESLYVVTRDYEVKYQIEGKNGTDSIIVPAGMVTDLVSVPEKWRWAYGRVGDHLEAAIVHDWLYCAWQLFHPHNNKGGVTPLPPAHYKKFAEDIFYHLLRDSGHWYLEARGLRAAVDSHGEEAFYGLDCPIVIEDPPCSELAQETTKPKNPYPTHKVEIERAFYVQDLCLGRRKGANTKSDSHSLYMVTRDYRVEYQLKGATKRHSVTVPAGMYTRLAMGPEGVDRTWEKVGKHLEAAIVHEWLYCAWQHLSLYNKNNRTPTHLHWKNFADDLLFFLLDEARYNPKERDEFYAAVRKGGMSSFLKWKKGTIIETEKKRICC